MPTREQIEKLLRAEPDDVFLNYSLAMQFAKEALFDDALRQFDRVIALDPDYCAAYHHKANTQVAAGQLDAARRTLEAGTQAAQRAGNSHAHSEMLELLASIEG